MALKHRVVQRFELADRPLDVPIALAGHAIREWLFSRPGEPSLPRELGVDFVPIGGGYEASYQRIGLSGGAAARWRFLVGDAPFTYLSTITLWITEGEGPSWLWYDVEASRESANFSPPKLTRALSKALKASPRDRISGFTEGLVKVTAPEVGRFLDEVLEAEDRVVPAFISGSGNWTYEDEEHVENAFESLYGLATFWKLAPDAFEEFNLIVKSGYEVYPGSIHSFQQGLDTTDEFDTRRHWWFAAAEVRQSRPWELSRRLHTEAMRSGVHVPLPAELIGLNLEFDRSVARSAFEYFERSLDKDLASTASDRPETASIVETVEVAAGGPPDSLPVLPSRLKPVPGPPRQSIPASERQQQLHQPQPDSPTGQALLEAAPQKRSLEEVLAPSKGSAPFVSAELEIESIVNEAASQFEVRHPAGVPLKQRLKDIFEAVRKQVAAVGQRALDIEMLKRFQRQVDTLVTEKGQLEKENDELNELIGLQDQEAKDYNDTLEQQREIAERERNQADHLRRELSRLATRGHADVEWEAPANQRNQVTDLPAPGSVNDLLDQLEQLSCVVFTGDRKTTASITDARLREIILRDAWRYACELERYALKRVRGKEVLNMTDYVSNHSTQLTKSEFASDESGNVKGNAKYSRPRTLKVPVSVDSSGSVFMGAHFRLSQDNGKAMRMHFHDSTSADGKIYVGYIGPHLPSRMSS